MADGNRQQAVRLEQSLDAGDGFGDEGPGLLEELGIRREPVVVGNDGDQLPVAVVLHEPIGSVAVDAARDETIRALVWRIPADELAELPLLRAHPQQRCAHDGAVANPGARVAPGPGLQRRAGARHEYVRGRRERSADGVHRPPGAGPLRCGKLLRPIECRLPDRERGMRRRTFHDALRRCARLERQIEGERARGKAERIVHSCVRAARGRL